MGSLRRSPSPTAARLALAVASSSLGLAVACTHAQAPVVDDPFIVPPKTTRAEPFAAAPDAGGACSPGDVSTFKPVWKEPSTFYQGVCTGGQAATVAGCVVSGSTSACKAFLSDPTNAACVQCAFTDTSATRLGAVITYRDQLIDVNYADCFANAEGDLTADGCGAQIQARQFCALAACSRCNTTTSAGVTAAQACAITAEEQPGCKDYTDASVCEYDLLNGPGTICLTPARGGLEAAANQYINLFCGKNPTADAGPG